MSKNTISEVVNISTMAMGLAAEADYSGMEYGKRVSLDRRLEIGWLPDLDAMPKTGEDFEHDNDGYRWKLISLSGWFRSNETGIEITSNTDETAGPIPGAPQEPYCKNPTAPGPATS